MGRAQSRRAGDAAGRQHLTALPGQKLSFGLTSKQTNPRFYHTVSHSIATSKSVRRTLGEELTRRSRWLSHNRGGAARCTKLFHEAPLESALASVLWNTIFFPPFFPPASCLCIFLILLLHSTSLFSASEACSSSQEQMPTLRHLRALLSHLAPCSVSPCPDSSSSSAPGFLWPWVLLSLHLILPEFQQISSLRLHPRKLYVQINFYYAVYSRVQLNSKVKVSDQGTDSYN